MKLELDEIRLAINFANILSKKNLYILGAGVSANYIKPIYKQIDKVIDSLTEQGGFPIGEGAELTEKDQYRLKIIESNIPIISSKPDYAYAKFLQQKLDIYDVLAHKYPWHATLICADTYSLDAYPNICPEYSIFNFAHPNSLIVSMNHDSLASHFIKNKKTISLHGEILPESKKCIKELLTFPLDADITPYLPKNLYVATREFESELIFSDKYIQLINILRNEIFDNLVIIGYSFFKRDAQHIYDEFTFEIINEHLSSKRCNCIIIDTDPFSLANLISNYIGSDSIYTINWANFIYSYIIAKKLSSAKLNNNHFSYESLMQFLKFYTYNKDIFSKDNPDKANIEDIIKSVYKPLNKSYDLIFYKNEIKLISNYITNFLYI